MPFQSIYWLLILLFAISLIVYLSYYFYLSFFNKFNFDENKITIGKDTVAWDEIEAMATISVFGVLGGLMGPGSGRVYSLFNFFSLLFNFFLSPNNLPGHKVSFVYDQHIPEIESGRVV